MISGGGTWGGGGTPGSFTPDYVFDVPEDVEGDPARTRVLGTVPGMGSFLAGKSYDFITIGYIALDGDGNEIDRRLLDPQTGEPFYARTVVSPIGVRADGTVVATDLDYERAATYRVFARVWENWARSI